MLVLHYDRIVKYYKFYLVVMVRVYEVVGEEKIPALTVGIELLSSYQGRESCA
jgi:hypothetical protein